MKTYTIPNYNTITNENSFVALHDLLVHDKADDTDAFDTEFDEEKRKEYFESAYKLFMMRCNTMHNTNAYLTKDDEKELRFMLDALIHARQAIYSHEFED